MTCEYSGVPVSLAIALCNTCVVFSGRLFRLVIIQVLVMSHPTEHPDHPSCAYKRIYSVSLTLYTYLLFFPFLSSSLPFILFSLSFLSFSVCPPSRYFLRFVAFRFSFSLSPLSSVLSLWLALPCLLFFLSYPFLLIPSLLDYPHQFLFPF